MSVITFDTLKFVRKLEELGIPLAQSEAAMAYAVLDTYDTAEFATKCDISDIKKDISDLKIDIERSELRVKINTISCIIALAIIIAISQYLFSK